MSLLKKRDVAAFCGGLFAAFLLGVLALGLAGCAATRPGAPTELPAAAPDRARVQRLDSAALAGWLAARRRVGAPGLPSAAPARLHASPAPAVAEGPGAEPGPFGYTSRQNQKQQRGHRPGATAINRNTSPVATQGSTATDVRKAGQR